jgi:hypothetical protein
MMTSRPMLSLPFATMILLNEKEKKVNDILFMLSYCLEALLVGGRQQ